MDRAHVINGEREQGKTWDGRTQKLSAVRKLNWERLGDLSFAIPLRERPKKRGRLSHASLSSDEIALLSSYFFPGDPSFSLRSKTRHFAAGRIKGVNMDFPLFDRFCVVPWIARA